MVYIFHASSGNFAMNRSHGLYSDPSFLSSDIDQGFVRPDKSEGAILDRAKVHGIETWDELAFQADFSRDRMPGKRLVDDTAIRQDLDLWAVLLDYSQMKDGSDGAHRILVEMLHGDNPVKLYADSVSGHIWHTLLPVMLAEEKLLYELCQVGSAFIADKPYVFGDIIGQLLASGNIRLAIVFGTQLLASHFRGHLDLLHLFDIAFQVADENALRNFCTLLSRLPRHRIYTDTIPKLWDAGRTQHAFILHKHLLSLGDYPADFEQLEPCIQALASKGLELKPFVRDMESYGISFSHQARRFYLQERATVVAQLGKPNRLTLPTGPGTRPVKLSDAFVARMFATRSVSFDFVLNGMRFIGLFEVGPLAIRELAIAATDLPDLKRRFRRLDEMEIDLGSSAYARVVKTLCMSDENELLQTLLHSDMHFEVFEDIQKQKRLLTEYLHQNKRKEMNRTLAILNAGETGIEAELNSARLMLHNALIEGDWRRALMKLDDIRETHQKSGERSELGPLRFALHRVWSGINSAPASDDSYLAHQQYLVGFMQFSSAAGLPVYPWQWRSVLHAVGRSGDWALFRQLLLSMARMFNDCPQHLVGHREDNAAFHLSALDDFLDGPLQSFVIEVSLTADAENQDPQKLWLRGVKLLHDIKYHFQTGLCYSGTLSALEVRLQKVFSGVQPQARIHFIKLYMGCLKWAWSKHGSVALESEGGMHTYADLEQRIPDIAGLKLFQSRSRLVRQQRYPIDVEDRAGEIGELFPSTNEPKSRSTPFKRSSATGGNLSNEYVEEQDKGTVFYEDLLHPSYKRMASVQQT